MPPVGSKKLTGLRAVGITCGIGSMLVGARQAGFNVVGNIEWRKYYHHEDSQGRNTFRENFPGAFLTYTVDELTPHQLADATGCDLAIGHPECGCFSQLNPNKNAVNDPTDIPLFVDLVAKLRPRFFVMDDLPKSFIAFPLSEYAARLPEYDLFPEWVSNFHYGNPQRQRRRLFVVGALKSEKFVFVPGEFDHHNKVKDVVGDLLGKEGQVPNHDEHCQSDLCAKALHLDYHGHRATWAELAEYVNSQRPGQTIRYYKLDGTEGTRICTYKGHWNGWAHVMTGGLSALHPLRGNPFSIRERARIQGFPDDFVFYGTVLNDNGQWAHDRNSHMVKQTGKAMPVQFCRYVSELVAAHCSRAKLASATGARFLPANEYVDSAKKWFCQNVGYSSQDAACNHCWLKDSCELLATRTRAVDVGVKSLPIIQPKSVTMVTKPNPLTNNNFTRVPATAQNDPVVECAVDVMTESVNVVHGHTPEDYHCNCCYCQVVIGELKRRDGSYYSRNDRRRYYAPDERASTKDGSGHIAKTPLHVARWAVQQYTHKGDWVLDPTAGAGTTLVEAVTHGRNAAGVEIQTASVARANVFSAKKLAASAATAIVVDGDARNLSQLLSRVNAQFSLVVNNPPYSGDESQKGQRASGYQYDKSRANLAFLKEGQQYFDTVRDIYEECVRRLKPGGHFVVAVKDQMRNREPDGLHFKLCETLASISELEFVGTAFLRHYPGTLHLNTYFRHYGVHPPYYQTINVFKKTGEQG